MLATPQFHSVRQSGPRSRRSPQRHVACSPWPGSGLRGRGAACFVAFLLALLSLSQGWANSTTYSEDPDGKKVFYYFLEDLGYQVERRFAVKDLQSLDLLVVSELQPKESEVVWAWVKKGGILLYAPPLFEGVGLCSEVRFNDAFHFERNKTVGEAKAAANASLKLRKAGCTAILPQNAKSLISKTDDKKASLVFEVAEGKGKILTLAHGDLLVNDNLDRDDVVVILRSWLADNINEKAKVGFLEEKIGGNFWQMLKGANMVPLFLHALVLLALFYWMVAPRFGRGAPPLPARRRQFAEHARALGQLYRAAQVSGYALKQQYERVIGRIAGGSNRPTDLAELARLVATKTGRNTAVVWELLKELEAAMVQSGAMDRKTVQKHIQLSRKLASLSSYRKA